MIQEKINQENNGDACQDTNTNTGTTDCSNIDSNSVTLSLGDDIQQIKIKEQLKQSNSNCQDGITWY